MLKNYLNQKDPQILLHILENHISKLGNCFILSLKIPAQVRWYHLLQIYSTGSLSIFTCRHLYSTAQFKLDRTRTQHGLDTTRFSFHMHASLRVHTRLVMSNLPCKALVYTLGVCMMHAGMSGMHMPNLHYACMQIVSQ